MQVEKPRARSMPRSCWRSSRSAASAWSRSRPGCKKPSPRAWTSSGASCGDLDYRTIRSARGAGPGRSRAAGIWSRRTATASERKPPSAARRALSRRAARRSSCCRSRSAARARCTPGSTTTARRLRPPVAGHPHRAGLGGCAGGGVARAPQRHRARRLQRAAAWLTSLRPARSRSSRSARAGSRHRAGGRRPLLQLHHVHRSERRSGAVRLAGSRLCRAGCGARLCRARRLAGGRGAGCPQGHVFTRNSVSFHAADRRCTASCRASARSSCSSSAARRSRPMSRPRAPRRLSRRLNSSSGRAEASRLREEAEELQQQRHDRQLDQVRLSEQSRTRTHRHSQIVQELEEIDAEVERETAQQQQASDAARRAAKPKPRSCAQRAGGRARGALQRPRASSIAGARPLQAAQRRFQEAQLQRARHCATRSATWRTISRALVEKRERVRRCIAMR